jgi:hypothetical protein
MRQYTLDDFIDYYGETRGRAFWQSALQATADATAAVKNPHDVNGPDLANFWTLISGWLQASAPTAEAANALMLTTFYVPLRWRYEYLQSCDVPQQKWSRCDLSATQVQLQTWAHVKNSVFTFALTPQQRASGQRNVLANVIRKLCKNTNLCKLLLKYGVADARSLATMLAALAVQRARPRVQDPAAQHATAVVRSIDTFRLRSRSRARAPRRH